MLFISVFILQPQQWFRGLDKPSPWETQEGMWGIIVFLSCRANGSQITIIWPPNRSEHRQRWKIMRSSQSLPLTGFVKKKKKIKGETKSTVYVDMWCFENSLTISSQGVPRYRCTQMTQVYPGTSVPRYRYTQIQVYPRFLPSFPSFHYVMFVKEFW